MVLPVLPGSDADGRIKENNLKTFFQMSLKSIREEGRFEEDIDYSSVVFSNAEKMLTNLIATVLRPDTLERFKR